MFTMRYLYFVITLILSVDAFTEDVVLHVNAKLKNNFDTPESRQCHYEGTEEDDISCVGFYSWRLYEGKVKGVMAGYYGGKKIRFAVFQPEKIQRDDSKDMYIRLRQFTEHAMSSRLTTQYYVDDYAFPGDMVCFDQALRRPSNNALAIQTKSGVCYSKQALQN